MADIFISYAHEDREPIGRLSQALGEAGYSVWWDKQVCAGNEFSKETAAGLDAARVVLVVWSKASITSYWVADEAAEGRDSGRLVPLSLDGSAPPLGFRQFLTIDFSSWVKKGDDTPFTDLSVAIAARLHAPLRAIAAPAGSGLWPLSRRKLALGAAALVTAGVGSAALFGGGAQLSGVLPQRKGRKTSYQSIAVLPFADLSEKQDKRWFAEGIAEEILNTLARNRLLKVAARTSSFLFNSGKTDPEKIALALGVETLLEGSVRLMVDQLRITARLLDAETGFQLWAASYDRKANDLFAVQDEISAAIVHELDENMRVEVSRSRPKSLEAYEYFLSAKFQAEQRSPVSLKRARSEFGKVIALEPGFAPAYALLADAAWRSSVYDHGDMPNDQAMGLAQASLAKAYALDPRSVEARIVDASIKTVLAMEGSGDPGGLERGEEIAREVIREAPSYLPGYYEIVFNLQVQSRGKEALVFAESAIEMDPLGLMSNRKLATTLRLLGRFKEAAEVATRAIAYHKNSNLLAVALWGARSDQGDTTGAVAALLPQLEATPDDFTMRYMLTYCLAYLGFESEALALAPNVSYRNLVLAWLGKGEDLPKEVDRGDPVAVTAQGIILQTARRFTEAISPLANAAGAKTVMDTIAIARLAHCYRAIGAVPAAGEHLQELDRLIAMMEKNGEGDTWYYDAKTLSLALHGDADALFGSKQFVQYLSSLTQVHPPFELDPMFDAFKADPRHAQAVVWEVNHKRRKRRELLASGAIEKIQGAIARIAG